MPAHKKPREPGDHKIFERIGDCGKCGAKLTVTKKKTKAGVVYASRHLCSAVWLGLTDCVLGLRFGEGRLTGRSRSLVDFRQKETRIMNSSMGVN